MRGSRSTRPTSAAQLPRPNFRRPSGRGRCGPNHTRAATERARPQPSFPHHPSPLPHGAVHKQKEHNRSAIVCVCGGGGTDTTAGPGTDSLCRVSSNFAPAGCLNTMATQRPGRHAPTPAHSSAASPLLDDEDKKKGRGRGRGGASGSFLGSLCPLLCKALGVALAAVVVTVAVRTLAAGGRGERRDPSPADGNFLRTFSARAPALANHLSQAIRCRTVTMDAGVFGMALLPVVQCSCACVYTCTRPRACSRCVGGDRSDRWSVGCLAEARVICAYMCVHVCA